MYFFTKQCKQARNRWKFLILKINKPLACARGGGVTKGTSGPQVKLRHTLQCILMTWCSFAHIKYVLYIYIHIYNMCV